MVYIVNIFMVGLYLWLSVLAFRRWKSGAALRRYAFIFLLSGLWLLDSMFETIFTKANPSNVFIQDVLGRANFFLAALDAPFFASFAIHFPKESARFSRLKELLFFLPASILAFLSLFGVFFYYRIVAGRIVYYASGYYWGYIGILIVYFLCITIGVLLYKYFCSRGISKLQLLYLLIGYSITIIIMLADSIANAVTDVNDYYDSWITNAAIIFLGLSAFSVVKHRLFGLRFLIRKGVVFTITTFLLFFFYAYGLLKFRQELRPTHFSDTVATAATVLLIVISYPLLSKFVRRIVDGLFVPSPQIRRDKLGSKVMKFSENVNYTALFRALEKELRQKLSVKNIRGLGLERKEGYDNVYPTHRKYAKFDRSHDLVHLLAYGERLLVKDEIPFLMNEGGEGDKQRLENAEKILYNLNAEIVVLLGSPDVAPALLFLEEKPDHSAYTAEELSLIKEIALERSSMFDQFFLYQQALRRVGVEV